MAYFACRNGNGGSGENTVGMIVVAAYEGTTITCTKDSVTLSETADSSEQVTFYVPEIGDWVLTDGEKSFTVTVEEYESSFKVLTFMYKDGVFGCDYSNPIPSDFKVTLYSGSKTPTAATLEDNCIVIQATTTGAAVGTGIMFGKVSLATVKAIKVTYALGSSLTTLFDFELEITDACRTDCNILIYGYRYRNANNYYPTIMLNITKENGSNKFYSVMNRTLKQSTTVNNNVVIYVTKVELIYE